MITPANAGKPNFAVGGLLLHLLNQSTLFSPVPTLPPDLHMVISPLRTLLVSLSLIYGFTAFAQLNDECNEAILIADPENFCSAVGEGATTGATASNVPPSGCFNINSQDVWFSFVAVASEATVIIRGLTFDMPGGTLLRPTVALYRGPCDALTELDCQSDLFFNNTVELSVSGLTPGETYYFRVEGVIPGTFQYCLRNYFFNGTLSGDCPTAVILCDKSPFNVEVVEGAGNDPTELDDAPCFNGFASETNSTWYVFTAANSGSLEFTLTPNNPADDLDFVVYRLPNGVGDCSGKNLLRCMAAGDIFFPSPCMGPTGLNSSATDISEDAGCAANQDNFLAALQMVPGATYALAVNNFTASGNGFQIEWGGTGNFMGPNAGFVSDQPDSTLCLGETITFTDASTNINGAITAWHWNFGLDAQPDTVSSQGPHTVQYTTAGSKTVSLRVKTATGCEVTVTRTFLVETCCGLSAGFVGNNADSTVCLGKSVVFTDTSSTDNGLITSWQWDFGAGAQPDTANTAGPHTVQYATAGSKIVSLRVETSTGCDVTVTRTLTVDTCCVVSADFVSSIADSTVCLGDTIIFTDASTTGDGTITAWRWDFGGGAQPAIADSPGPHTVQYATAGSKIISLRVESSTGCDATLTRTFLVDTCCVVSAGFFSNNADSTVCLGKGVVFTDTSSTGNGTITRWQWDFGLGAQPDTALTAGPHTVRYATAGSKMVSLRVGTSLGCTAVVSRMLQVDTCCAVSAAIEFPLDCATPCTTATVVVTNAFPPVAYQWSSGQTDSVATDLAPGDYIITVTDALGCTDTVSFRIEPSAQFDIPNAFTPNGDSVNDVFFPVGEGFEVLELVVYSRWGQKVWSGNSGGWDGRLDGNDLPSDVYAYRSKVRFKGVVEERKGEVMLLR